MMFSSDEEQRKIDCVQPSREETGMSVQNDTQCIKEMNTNIVNVSDAEML